MYVRDARNREEVWLLDHIEAMGLDDAAFRSRDYVIAVDEESNDRAGFGRIRIHKEPDACEITGIGVLDGWRDQGVGAHVIERLLQKAGDEGFEEVYSLTDQPEYLVQFGFEFADPGELPAPIAERISEKRETVSDEVQPLRIDVDGFEMPDRLRERFKSAAERDAEDEGPEETPEDFGIDPDEATYKYDPRG
ncbi:Acetyltransferase (GNAT family) [Halalkaliarchaeum sp. AArc-CO]|uniref:GNAT family N-acetyltransferase n=1 Tax=unclassified Halalkaliarchaeum TaxID=2678344 RepID=UPI00217D7CA2|nr:MULTISPECIES: GNAT family N-acetyltransferase [unclassified Halalkaliarchaeum]MDR5673181.1 GNAT family N-acetyltransferase [Halalkaliarchaeum sp. AArc-GB]UWG51864.1 Acetyltransferase (GNAT family) [Halalkaliarchaeum sp. AArc-CO]